MLEVADGTTADMQMRSRITDRKELARGALTSVADAVGPSRLGRSTGMTGSCQLEMWSMSCGEISPARQRGGPANGARRRCPDPSRLLGPPPSRPCLCRRAWRCRRSAHANRCGRRSSPYGVETHAASNRHCVQPWTIMMASKAIPITAPRSTIALSAVGELPVPVRQRAAVVRAGPQLARVVHLALQKIRREVVYQIQRIPSDSISLRQLTGPRRQRPAHQADCPVTPGP